MEEFCRNHLCKELFLADKITAMVKGWRDEDGGDVQRFFFLGVDERMPLYEILIHYLLTLNIIFGRKCKFMS